MISKTIGFRGTHHFQTHPFSWTEHWRYGYNPGCLHVDPSKSRAAYHDAVWYSLPGRCPSRDLYSTTAKCLRDEPGGNCDAPNGHLVIEVTRRFFFLRKFQGNLLGGFKLFFLFSISYIPIGSMYAIYGNIYHHYTPFMLAYNIYTIHRSYGIWDHPNPIDFHSIIFSKMVSGHQPVFWVTPSQEPVLVLGMLSLLGRCDP